MELSFHLGALLLTYAMHSTLLIGGVWLIIRLVKPRSPELREMLWKTALLGGVLTALASWLLPLPHWGNVLRLALPGAFEHVLEALPESGAVLNESGIIVTTEERPDALAQTAVADTGFDWTGAAQAALPWLFWCWLGLSAAGFFRLACAWRRLLLLQQQGVLVSDGDLPRATRRLLRGFGLDRQVEIWMVPGLQGPMVAGLRRWRLFLPEGFFSRLNEAEREAVLAHELAHLARGDGWWLLAGRVISCLFFIQPLNVVACRHLRAEAEYLADQRALTVLPDEVGLARSLVLLGEWLLGPGAQPAPHPLASGMGSSRSLLGRRVEQLLAGPQAGAARWLRWVTAGSAAALLAVALAAPRAIAESPNPSSSQHQPEATMKKTVISQAAALLAGTALFAAVPAQAENEKPDAKPSAEAAAALPETLHGFSGHLYGKLISKDVEGGSLVMQVNKLLHVWKGNKASQPKDVEGRTLTVTSIHGKALDVLITLKPGDWFEIETKSVRGPHMEYLGEGIKKVSAPEEGESSVSASGREAMHGFRGMFVGTLVEKDQEKGTLAVKIERVTKLWKQNAAKNAEAAIGQTWKINGVTGKWLDTLLTLKAGDCVEVEAFHHRGDELDFVGEWLKKADAEPASESSAKSTGSSEDLHGFRGALIGKLLSKDIEKGEVEIEVDTVKTVFKNNKAPRPESAVGQRLRIQKIAGKFIDRLLAVDIGERIELAAFHNHGDAMDFPGELLRKVEADSTSEPSAKAAGSREDMHGFRGVLIGKVLSKDIEKGEVEIEVDTVKLVAKKSTAPRPESAVGQKWRIQKIAGNFLDTLLAINIGERIELAGFHYHGDVLDFPGELLRKAE